MIAKYLLHNGSWYYIGKDMTLSCISNRRYDGYALQYRNYRDLGVRLVRVR